MNTTQSKSWNTKNLVQFGSMLSEGYDPGLGHSVAARSTWTTQTQLRAAAMLGHGYHPGL
ncbi:MAG: hypothetical protein ACHWZW_19435 [Spirulina sp.]